MDKMQDYIEALRNGKGYTWISNYGHELNKYELIDIIKELTFSIHFIGDFDREDIFALAAENLKDIYNEE